jgi:PII-like signaling protein
MSIPEEGLLLRIFLGESDKHGHMTLYEWIVRKAKESGLAGATVLRGFEGFGSHGIIHTSKILVLSIDLPVVIEIVDTVEKIENFVTSIDKEIPEGLVTVQKVQINVYRGSYKKVAKTASALM